MPLPQESREKVHYSAENCNNGSYYMAASPQYSWAFIPHSHSIYPSLYFLTLFSAAHCFSLAQIKPSLPSPPSLVCSTLQQKKKNL